MLIFAVYTRCSDAGNWHFSGRKWIDPADPDGRIKLELHHNNLCLLYPAFAAACSCDRFIEAVPVASVKCQYQGQRHGRAAAKWEILPSFDNAAPGRIEDGGVLLAAWWSEADRGDSPSAFEAEA